MMTAPVSLGYQRYESFSRKKRYDLMYIFQKEGLGQTELTTFLENMTEEEFKTFKKNYKSKYFK